MSLLFWIAVLVIAYAYAGYPLWLWFRSRYRPHPVCTGATLPWASVVMAVHNEAPVLAEKITSLLALDYPADRLEIIVVSDGSTDHTGRILAAQSSDSVHVIICPQHEGKAAALRRGIEAARGEIVVFSDARQRVEPGALRHLVANFADPAVGCVTGELLLGNPESGALEGVGLYWKMEKKIRQWEGASASVVGATGALYAVRRNLLVPPPPGTILDDVYIPLEVVRQGYRVVFEPRACVWDPLRATPRQELRRKIRTLTGNYQLLQLAPWLLRKANPLRFEFISHKLFRLIVPFALGATLVSSFFLRGGFYRIALALQLAFYALGALALLRPKLGVFGRVSNLAFSFLLLNTAAVIALIDFSTGRKRGWVRTEL